MIRQFIYFLLCISICNTMEVDKVQLFQNFIIYSLKGKEVKRLDVVNCMNKEIKEQFNINKCIGWQDTIIQTVSNNGLSLDINYTYPTNVNIENYKKVKIIKKDYDNGFTIVNANKIL